MSEFPYLVALALLNEKGKRAMPLGGKSIKEDILTESFLGSKAETIALELLIRLLKRSEGNPINIAAKGKSLILAQINLDSMQKQLPHLKAEWINKGDSDLFIVNLKDISQMVWSLDFDRYKGILFEPI